MGDTDIDAIMRLMSGSGMDYFIEKYVQDYVDNQPVELTEEEKQEQRREKFGTMSCPFDGFEDTNDTEGDDLEDLLGADEEEGDFGPMDYRGYTRRGREARRNEYTDDDYF